MAKSKNDRNLSEIEITSIELYLNEGKLPSEIGKLLGRDPSGIRKEIKNRTLRSFLYYVPYVTLAVMTFPAIMDATQTPAAGLIALAAGIFLAWIGRSMFEVAIVAVVLVYVLERFMF